MMCTSIIFLSAVVITFLSWETLCLMHANAVLHHMMAAKDFIYGRKVFEMSPTEQQAELAKIQGILPPLPREPPFFKFWMEHQ